MNFKTCQLIACYLICVRILKAFPLSKRPVLLLSIYNLKKTISILMKNDTLSTEPIKRIPNKFRFDSCGRRCTVSNGRLVNCYRVRKDFESMPITEQRRYVQAFKTISTRQPYKRAYDKLIKMHEAHFDSRIHQKTEFLPWHRSSIFLTFIWHSSKERREIYLEKEVNVV